MIFRQELCQCRVKQVINGYDETADAILIHRVRLCHRSTSCEGMARREGWVGEYELQKVDKLKINVDFWVSRTGKQVGKLDTGREVRHRTGS